MYDSKFWLLHRSPFENTIIEKKEETREKETEREKKQTIQVKCKPETQI